MNPFSLHNKTILVTGASSGIGRSVAEICSQMGASLIITGRNPARLAETFNSLGAGRHIQYIADLNKQEEMESLIEIMPMIDGLICSAGVINYVAIRSLATSDINDILQTNVYVPINITRTLVQKKKLNKCASLIYISSINGNNCVSIGSSIYAASKSSLTGFMKSAALELAISGVRANCINPGMIETDLLKADELGSDELERDRLKYPLKRYGKPEEVAYAAVYLLSDASRWITGSSIVIDGGFTLQ